MGFGKPQTGRGLNRKERHREPEVTSSNMADGGHVVWGGKPRTQTGKTVGSDQIKETPF